jgi:predicted 2-oxoglutarate/Fe(II)-dependent dioxygenase YbiX
MPPNPGQPVPVLSIPACLNRATCARLRLGMDGGRPEEAEVLLDRGAGGIDVRAEVRRAHGVEVAPDLLPDVECILDAQMAAVATAFGVHLTGREGCGFVRYGPGGFYRPHRDWADTPSWPGAARRQIATVLFLNSSREADPAGEFEGGQLRLYAENEGVAPVEIVPCAGTLVAFLARQWHEVTMVRGGTRDVVVDWYY